MQPEKAPATAPQRATSSAEALGDELAVDSSVSDVAETASVAEDASSSYLDKISEIASGAARITAGVARKLDASLVVQGKGKTGAPPVPRAISLHEKYPPVFSTRATSRPSRSLSAMFMVTAYDPT